MAIADHCQRVVPLFQAIFYLSDETIAVYLAELAEHGGTADIFARVLMVTSQTHQAADLAGPVVAAFLVRLPATW
jgi:hypothetical protein